MASEAKRLANETRALNGFAGRAHLRADGEYSGDRCWMISETEVSAVVVYEDDPSAVCSVGNRPGRFTECTDHSGDHAQELVGLQSLAGRI